MGLRHLAVLGAFFVLLIQPLGSAEELTNPAVYTIHENYTATNPGPGDAAVTVYLLRDWSGWASQQVLTESLPSGQVSSTVDNKTIHISIPPGDRTITYTQTVMVYGYDLQLKPSAVGDSVQAGFGYTSLVDGLWENKPELVAKARELTDNQPNFYYKAKAIFEFVRDNIRYEKPIPFTALMKPINTPVGIAPIKPIYSLAFVAASASQQNLHLVIVTKPMLPRAYGIPTSLAMLSRSCISPERVWHQLI